MFPALVKLTITNRYLLLALTSFILFGCTQITNLAEIKTSYQSAPIRYSTYVMPPKGNDIVGKSFIARVKRGDTFTRIGKRYDIGARELMAANPRIHPRRMFVGAKIIIPAEFILPPEKYRRGIVINTAELRLYYFTQDNTVMTFPISIGREGWLTPLAHTYVYRKKEQPTWHVPKSIRDEYYEKTGKEYPLQIEPGSKNPLGDYAIYLHLNGYLIHGTNNDDSIGHLVSSGCIRMFNNDVKELFQYVKRGTPVNIIYYPNKVGYRDGQLYMESQGLFAKVNNKEYKENAITMKSVIEAMAEQKQPKLNYKKIQNVINNHTGIPTIIT